LPSAAGDNLCLLLCAPQNFPSLPDLVPLLNHPSSNGNETVNLISMVAKKHNTTPLRPIFQVRSKFTSQFINRAYYSARSPTSSWFLLSRLFIGDRPWLKFLWYDCCLLIALWHCSTVSQVNYICHHCRC
jgi:hypothetical protein